MAAGTFFDKRTGPIVAIATGGISDSDAKTLLGRVNYEASVTWNTPTSDTQVRDLYMLILNIVILCAILARTRHRGGRCLRWIPDSDEAFLSGQGF